MKEQSPEETSLTFSTGEDWVIKIIRRENGPQVEFNREKYPNSLPNDFAEAFGKILCETGYLNDFIPKRGKGKIWLRNR